MFWIALGAAAFFGSCSDSTETKRRRARLPSTQTLEAAASQTITALRTALVSNDRPKALSLSKEFRTKLCMSLYDAGVVDGAKTGYNHGYAEGHIDGYNQGIRDALAQGSIDEKAAKRLERERPVPTENTAGKLRRLQFSSRLEAYRDLIDYMNENGSMPSVLESVAIPTKTARSGSFFLSHIKTTHLTHFKYGSISIDPSGVTIHPFGQTTHQVTVPMDKLARFLWIMSDPKVDPGVDAHMKALFADWMKKQPEAMQRLVPTSLFDDIAKELTEVAVGLYEMADVLALICDGRDGSEELACIAICNVMGGGNYKLKHEGGSDVAGSSNDHSGSGGIAEGG